MKYVKPIRGLKAHDCGDPQFMDAPGQVLTFSSPKSGPVKKTDENFSANQKNWNFPGRQSRSLCCAFSLLTNTKEQTAFLPFSKDVLQ